MAGLRVGGGLSSQFGALPNLSGVTAARTTGTSGVTAAAFSPGMTPTVTAPGGFAALHPGTPFGMAFWWGVGAIAALTLIRHSLPR